MVDDDGNLCVEITMPDTVKVAEHSYVNVNEFGFKVRVVLSSPVMSNGTSFVGGHGVGYVLSPKRGKKHQSKVWFGPEGDYATWQEAMNDATNHELACCGIN